MKKKIALVFGITQNFTFALANTLIGLKKHNRKFWDDIIIYHNGIPNKEITCINKIVDCKFVNLQDEFQIDKIPKNVIKKYSYAVFYRYYCFKLLSDYNTIIWNDVDILITGNIEGLLDYGKNSGIAATLAKEPFLVENNFNKLISDYNMFSRMYNSGILVLHDNLKEYDKAFEWLLTKTVEYSKYLFWPDQGILNLYFQHNDLEVDLIDIDKFCCHPTHFEKVPFASIIHAYGDKKFWNCIEYKKEYLEWEQNDKEWDNIKNRHNFKQDFPLVSVIMSTYNRYVFLKESVESILNQTYKNIELIIVLEKSENQLLIEDIIKSYNDSRIVIIKNKKRQGFAESLNLAIKKSKGKYIARMDDDDISLPERIDKQVAFMEQNPEIGISGTKARIIMNYEGIIEIETDPEILKIITLFKTPFIHPTVIMRKSLILKNSLFYDKEYFTEDYELWSRAIEFFPIGNINEILLLYRANNQSLTSCMKNEKIIHNSHKKIMKNQFEKFLKMDVSDNELEIFQGRKDVMNGRKNVKEILDLKNNLIKKIVIQNQKTRFYKDKVLKKMLNIYKKEITPKKIVKKAIRVIIRPFYGVFMRKINNNVTNNLNPRLSNIENQLKSLEKKVDNKKND